MYSVFVKKLMTSDYMVLRIMCKFLNNDIPKVFSKCSVLPYGSTIAPSQIKYAVRLTFERACTVHNLLFCLCALLTVLMCCQGR